MVKCGLGSPQPERPAEVNTGIAFRYMTWRRGWRTRGCGEDSGGWWAAGTGAAHPPQAEAAARTQAGSASQSSGLPSNSQEEVWQSCKY